MGDARELVERLTRSFEMFTFEPHTKPERLAGLIFAEPCYSTGHVFVQDSRAMFDRRDRFLGEHGQRSAGNPDSATCHHAGTGAESRKPCRCATCR